MERDALPPARHTAAVPRPDTRGRVGSSRMLPFRPAFDRREPCRSQDRATGKIIRQYGVKRRRAVRSSRRYRLGVESRRAIAEIADEKFAVLGEARFASALKSSLVNRRRCPSSSGGPVRGGATTTDPIATSCGGRSTSCGSRTNRHVDDRLLSWRVQDASGPGLPGVECS